MSGSRAEIAKKLRSLLQNNTADEREDAHRLDEARRILARLVQEGEFRYDDQKVPPQQKKWHTFLRQEHRKLVNQLCDRIRKGKRTGIRTLWGVMASTPVGSTQDVLSAELMFQYVQAMCSWPNFEDRSVRNMLNEFFGPYRDAQYYGMGAITRQAARMYEANSHEDADKLLEMLMIIPIVQDKDAMDASRDALFPPPEEIVDVSDDDDEEEEESDDDASRGKSSDDDSVTAAPPRKKKKTAKEVKRVAFLKASRHHAAWSKAWLAVLRLHLSTSGLRKALRFLPDNVLRYVPNPLRFSDFFMQAYDGTGVTPVLALDGIFELLTKYGLEYPKFYKQLYKIVTTKVMYVKYRSQFFRLLENCLFRNQMLPAHIVAAFIKRLLRCSLRGPVPSTLFILALCNNLLLKRPELSCLTHRDSLPDGKDGFNADTDDPEEANALASSLWELDTLERHYFPAVSTMAKSIGCDDKGVMLQTEAYLSQSYTSLFDSERKRQLRKDVALTFRAPTGLFAKGDIASTIFKLPENYFDG